MWLDVFQHFIIALDPKLCSHLCFVFLFSVCCPYNGLFAIPLILAIVALILFNYAAFSCQTFKFEKEGYYTETEYFGFWTYEDEDDECQSIDKELDDEGADADWDAAWKTGRAATIIGSVFSYVLVIMLLVNSCVRYPRMLFNLMAGGMFFTALMSGLLLVGLASDPAEFGLPEDILAVDFTPQFGPGAGVAVAAFVLWIGAGASMFCCMQERNIMENNVGGHQQAVAAQPTYATKSAYTYPSPAPVPMTAAVPQDVAGGTVSEEVDIVEHPDGHKTKTTTTTTTMPDGSQQVVKSVEEIW